MNTSHYPSLELCKKLTEIGFPATEKSMVNSKTWNEPDIMENHENWYPEGSTVDIFVCPSVMEMLDMVPNKIYVNEIKKFNDFFKIDETTFQVTYGDVRFQGTFPNALAEMVLWLHENGHIRF